MSFPSSEKRTLVWNQLREKNFVTGEIPEYEHIESPWYVRLLVGFSGWLAALFMLAFFAVGFEIVYENKILGFVFGSGLIFVAYKMLVKKSISDFSSQFALAISFSGQALLVFSLNLFESFSGGDAINWLLLAGIQFALAWYMPNSIHRAWSAFAAIIGTNIALAIWHIYFIQTVFIMFVVAIVWLNEFKWIEQHKKIKAMGYGFTLALLYQASWGNTKFLLLSLSGYKSNMAQPWLRELLAGLVILYVVFELLKRQSIKIPSRVAIISLAGSIILIFASMKMFGITVGVVIILLGYANGNRILTSLGIASLIYYISAYYYSLHITLLDKSQLLAILGILLLLASWLIRRVLFVNLGGNDNAK